MSRREVSLMVVSGIAALSYYALLFWLLTFIFDHADRVTALTASVQITGWGVVMFGGAWLVAWSMIALDNRFNR